MKHIKFSLLIVFFVVFLFSDTAFAQNPDDCIECFECERFTIWNSLCGFIHQVCIAGENPSAYCDESRNECEKTIANFIYRCRQNCENDCATTDTCPDGTCTDGERCPRDVDSCEDRVCYKPTCLAGCAETPITNAEDRGECDKNNAAGGCASPPCICNSGSDCVSASSIDCVIDITSDKTQYCQGDTAQITIRLRENSLLKDYHSIGITDTSGSDLTGKMNKVSTGTYVVDIVTDTPGEKTIEVKSKFGICDLNKKIGIEVHDLSDPYCDVCSLPAASLDTQAECEESGCDWLSGTQGCGDGIEQCGYESHDYGCSIKSSLSEKWSGAISKCVNCDCSWCCCPAFENDDKKMPDLIIDKLIIYDHEKEEFLDSNAVLFKHGKTYGLYPVIKNIGELSTRREALSVQIKVDDGNILGRVSTAVGKYGTLDIGKSIKTSDGLDYTVSSDSFEVELAVDIDESDTSNSDKIAESNENNNRWSATYKSIGSDDKKPPCDSYGDVDNDGFVTSYDLDIVSDAWSQGLDLNSNDYLPRADLNGNQELDTLDILILSDYIDNKSPHIPVCSKICHIHTDPSWVTDGAYNIRIKELGCEEGDCAEVGGYGKEALIEIMSGDHCGEQFWIWVDREMSPNSLVIGTCYEAEIFTTLYGDNCGHVVRYLVTAITCPVCDRPGPADCKEYGEEFWCDTYDGWKLECQGRGASFEDTHCSSSTISGGICVSCAKKCLDTDAGIDLFVKGKVMDMYSPNTVNLEDRCLSSDQLLEYSCENDAWHVTDPICPNGCEDGACIKEEPQCHNHMNFPLLTKNDYDITILEKGCTDSAGIEYLIELKEQNHPMCGIKLWVWLEPGIELLDVGGCYRSVIILGYHGHMITSIGIKKPSIDCLPCDGTSTYGKLCDDDTDCSSPLKCKTTGRYDGSYDSDIRNYTEKYCCSPIECASVINGPCVMPGGTDISDFTSPGTVLKCVYNDEADQSEYVVDCEKTYGKGYWCGTVYNWMTECDSKGDLKETPNNRICSLDHPDAFNCISCELSCTDSDGGFNTAVKGELYWSVQDFKATDICRGDYLHEYFCKGDGYSESDYLCPNGCEDGACIEKLSYLFDLHAGENMISFPQIPSINSPASIFKPISHKMHIVWSYDVNDIDDPWEKYDPIAPFANDLSEILPGRGYIIIMKEPATLSITGSPVLLNDLDLLSGLSAGDNLIGPGNRDIPLDGIYALWQDSKETGYLNYTILEKGKSYWISCDALETGCSDSLDNDCDGLMDKKDPDCNPDIKKPPCGSYGDSDNDGFVTNADADMLRESLSGKIKLTSEQKRRLDLNNNSIVDLKDLLYLEKYLDGSETTFPVCKDTVVCTNTDPIGNTDVVENTPEWRSILATKGICTDKYGVHEDICTGTCCKGTECQPCIKEYYCKYYPEYDATYNTWIQSDCRTYGFDACEDGACVKEKFVDCQESYGADYRCYNYSEWKSIGAPRPLYEVGCDTDGHGYGYCAPSLASCKDSDSGKNYYESGYVSGLDKTGNKYSYPDICELDPSGSGKMGLKEMYCEGPEYKSLPFYLCPSGCNDGACIQKEHPIDACNKYGEEFWCGTYDGWKKECQGNGASFEDISCSSSTTPGGICVSCAKKCLDTDSGIDQFVKGKVLDMGHPDTISLEDRCLSSGQLLEYSCVNDAWYANYPLCPNGCEDGACIENPSYLFDLHAGENMISFPQIPSVNSPASIFKPISHKMHIVWSYDVNDIDDPWEKYDPIAPFANDLSEILPGRGYIIIMKEPATLSIMGSPVLLNGHDLLSGLSPGDNLIGPGNRDIPLDGIYALWQDSKETGYLNYTILEKGKSYWISCDALETVCSDSLDNDCDGLMDKKDPDCNPDIKKPPCGSYGDLNDDGLVNEPDLDLMRQFSVGYPATSQQQIRANLNLNDMYADSGDILLIESYVLGEIGTFPVCSDTHPTCSCLRSGTSIDDVSCMTKMYYDQACKTIETDPHRSVNIWDVTACENNYYNDGVQKDIIRTCLDI